jgi:hypothetical protein
VASGPVKASEYPTKLGKKIMAALDGIPHFAHARLACATFGGLHAQPRLLGALLSRSMAVRPSRLDMGQTPLLAHGHRRLGRGGVDHQTLEEEGGLTPGIGIGPGYDGPERHGPGVTGEGESRAALAALDRTGAGLFAPFCAGFFAPSRRR